MDPAKAQATVSSIAYKYQQGNKPFLDAVARAIEKGVPEEMARRLTWAVYYQNGKDALLGDERSAAGLTAAESRAEDVQVSQQATQLGISRSEVYERRKAADTLLDLASKPRVFGGRTKRRSRSKKTSKRRQSRRRV